MICEDFIIRTRWYSAGLALRLVGLVVVLLVISTLALLYLPRVNAAIIDDGVANGDTATIMQLGAVMLVVSGLQILCSVGAVHFGSFDHRLLRRSSGSAAKLHKAQWS